jgi:hypothetical protein
VGDGVGVSVGVGVGVGVTDGVWVAEGTAPTVLDGVGVGVGDAVGVGVGVCELEKDEDGHRKSFSWLKQLSPKAWLAPALSHSTSDIHDGPGGTAPWYPVAQ